MCELDWFQTDDEMQSYLNMTDYTVSTYIEQVWLQSMGRPVNFILSKQDIEKILVRREIARSLLYDK